MHFPNGKCLVTCIPERLSQRRQVGHSEHFVKCSIAVGRRERAGKELPSRWYTRRCGTVGTGKNNAALAKLVEGWR